MSEIGVRIETPLNPTEDPDKVARAIHNLFPGANLVTVGTDARHTRLEATMSGLDALDNLKTILRQEGIRDAARRLVLGGISGSSIVVHLHKQAAFAGKASFCERYDESPLGPITLTITSESPERVVDWLAPSSRSSQRS
jgi:predicted RNA binding protein with dsRBD fold (UPF0201 family)